MEAEEAPSLNVCTYNVRTLRTEDPLEGRRSGPGLMGMSLACVKFTERRRGDVGGGGGGGGQRMGRGGGGQKLKEDSGCMKQKITRLSSPNTSQN